MTKDAIINFFHQNFPGIKESRSLAEVSTMFDRYENSYCYKYRNGKVEFLSIYMMISDKYMDMIEANPKITTNHEFILECANNKGKNLHFLIALGPGAGNILSCLKDVIKRERPDTISWVKADSKLHWIKRR